MPSPRSRLPLAVPVVALLAAALVAPGTGAAAVAASGHAPGTARTHPAGSPPDGAGVAGRNRVVPQALLHGSTSPSHRAAAVPLAAAPGDASDLGPPLPLATLPVGTYVTNQFEKDGIIFSGQSPFIADDGASTVNPTISGTPKFQGTVVGTFVQPGTTTPATVDDFSVVVGYIDTPSSTQMTVYDHNGVQLGVLVADHYGFNQLRSTFPGAAYFSISSVSGEPAGWEVNTIQIGPVNAAYAALGDSYSSGEGTYDFPWSHAQGTQCDTGPEAWPVQMAAAQNASTPGMTDLSIDMDTLIACQGKTTSDLDQAVNGEKKSELAQLSDLAVKKGPPTLVTITIGGNDLGFSSILTDCFLGGAEGCLTAAQALDKRVTAGAGGLIATLAYAYQEVKAAAGDGTTVVVAGYPNLFPQPGGDSTALSVTYNCPWLRGSTTVPSINVSPVLNELLATLSAAQAAINDDMTAAAAQAGVPFIPIPFSLQGHELCSSDPYIVPIGLIGGALGDRNLGHPNVAGSAAIAAAVGSQLGLATAASAGGADGGQEHPRQPAPPALRALRARRAHLAGGTHRATGAVRRGVRPADGGPLSFTGGTLSGGTVGGGYVDYLVATGGTGTDTWSVTGGSLPAGLSLDTSTGTITGTPSAAGTFTFTAQVTDSSTPTPQTASGQVTITVDDPAALTVASTQPADATAGQPYSYTESATGGLGQLSWSVIAGALPAGLTLDGTTGQITGVPQASDTGTSDFTVQASDSSSPAQVVTAAESITVHPQSDPLTVTTASLPEVTAGQPYAAQLTSTGGVAPVQWSVASGSLPPGMSLDAATGVLSGTPVQAGTYDLTAQVADGTAPVSQTASAGLSITVGAPPALGITTGGVFDGTQGVAYSSTVQATGGAGAYSWQVSSGALPAGLTLNPATGQITGTPAGSGTAAFGVTVGDAAGDTAAQDYQITIAPSALKVAGTLLPATVGTYYTANVTPSGGLTPYGWSLVSGTLPPGLSFDPATGAITGTPAQSGTFPLDVLVTDSSAPSQQVAAHLTLKVRAAPALQVSSRAPVQGIAGTFYTTGIGFDGGQGPYTWDVTAGQLPPGLTMDPASGMILGTPSSAGSYPVTVQLTDSSTPDPQTASASFTLTIASPAPLDVSSATLPGAVQGMAYSADLPAAGGVPPYTWTMVSGSLPAGLQLSSYPGQVAGTPSGHGSSVFTLQVKDAASDTATRSVKLTVDPGAPVSVTTVSLDDAVQGSAYSQTLSAAGGLGPYAWTLAGGKLPAGLQLSGTGVITGTPAHFGYSTFTVKAADQSTPAAKAGTRRLSLAVETEPVSPPAFTGDSPTSPVGAGTSYHYQFAAAGNPAPTFTVSSGHLPSGLQLQRDGLLAGTAAHAGTYTFQVTARNGRSPDAVSPELRILVQGAPVITSITPDEAAPGVTVDIDGQNLENASYVEFDGSFATITSDTAKQIVTSVPEYASSGPVYVVTPGGSAQSSGSFTVDPPPAPVITSISPTSGSPGSTLTIDGTGLQFAFEVVFGGDVAVFNSDFYSDTPASITLPVPGGASPGPVTVYTGGGSATSSQTFTPSG